MNIKTKDGKRVPKLEAVEKRCLRGAVGVVKDLALIDETAREIQEKLEALAATYAGEAK